MFHKVVLRSVRGVVGSLVILSLQIFTGTAERGGEKKIENR